MIRKEPVMALRRNLGQVLNEVEYKHDTIIITRDGHASAAIINMNLFEKIRQMKNRFSQLTRELQSAFSDLVEQEKDDLIDEALLEARIK
ncbi:MAG: prevent-host-death protein [Rickettsiales bacterium]|nr:MAG: prevent-host-death protein [Rickettsiales bacterium]